MSRRKQLDSGHCRSKVRRLGYSRPSGGARTDAINPGNEPTRQVTNAILGCGESLAHPPQRDGSGAKCEDGYSMQTIPHMAATPDDALAVDGLALAGQTSVETL